MMGVVREVNETQVPACLGAACGTKVHPVTELGFDYASLHNPILTDSAWVEEKISLLRKLTILGRRWTHVPKNQLPIDHQGTRVFKGEFQGCTGRGGIGVTCRTTQSAPTFILNLSCGNLISIILIVLTVFSLISRLVCSQFLETSSQNCVRWSS